MLGKVSLKIKPMVKARSSESKALSCSYYSQSSFILGFDSSSFWNKKVLLCIWSSVTPFFSQMRILRLRNITDWHLSQFSIPGVFSLSLLAALLSCSVPLMSSDQWEKKDKEAFSSSVEPYSTLGSVRVICFVFISGGLCIHFSFISPKHPVM